MPTPYNHKAIEKKWRTRWKEHPVNVQEDERGKHDSITASTCSHIRLETVCT